MAARLEYLACYVGSAAVVAFLAACLDAPRVDTFTCDAAPDGGAEHCVPVQQGATTPGTDRVAVVIAP